MIHRLIQRVITSKADLLHSDFKNLSASSTCKKGMNTLGRFECLFRKEASEAGGEDRLLLTIGVGGPYPGRGAAAGVAIIGRGYRKLTFAHVRQAQCCVQCTF